MEVIGSTTVWSSFGNTNNNTYSSSYSDAAAKALAAGLASVFNPNGQIHLDGGGNFDTNWKNSDIGSNTPNIVNNWINNGDAWSSNSWGWSYNGGSSSSGSSYSGGGGYYYSPPAPQPPPPPVAPTFNKEVQKELVKYEYLYGIKDLQIRGIEYKDKSIYISKPIQVDGNVMQVSLRASEEHPLFNDISGEATDRQTSVEYYISYVNTPGLSDWHPILPESEKYVRSELLFFESSRTASLRFPALISSYFEPRMYKDGILYTQWSFVAGGMKIQLLEERDPASVYAIDYEPNAELVDPWTIDIQQHGLQRVKQKDVFTEGTNHNKTIVLSKYPFVDYEKINTTAGYDPNKDSYRPFQVTLQNASIAGPNRTTLKEVLPLADGATVSTVNITDYKTKAWKEPKPYSLDKTNLYTNFEYWHEKNKLYFSETFNKSDIMTNQEINHGNAEIAVEYEYLVSNFRVKIILRRNGQAVHSVAPSVHDYTLKFKVMK